MMMIVLIIVSVLGAGAFWLRRAPELPAITGRLHPGMTLGEVESLLGHPFTDVESCLRGEHYLIIDDPLAGQTVCIDIGTCRHRHNQTTGELESITRADQPCVSVDIHRWSRVTWLNDHTWTRWLIGLPSDT